MELLDVLNHHLRGGGFSYKSYHHTKASADYIETDEYKSRQSEYDKYNLGAVGIGKHDLPIDLIEKHSYWRSGKIRKVEFNPNGTIYRIYIGAKWARTFYKNDLDDLKLIEP